jgi:TonB-linked SusC/RagA family outer membrane protein
MKEISGVVTDAATGSPMAGVYVKAYNLEKYSAMTDAQGAYLIRVPDYVTSLTMTVEGFNVYQCPIRGRSKSVNAALRSEVFKSDYQPLTSAAVAVEAKNFDNSSDVSVDEQIQSKLGSSVRSVMRSGMLGLGAVRFMNGVNSLRLNAQPLIVLDGVMVDMQYSRSMVHDGYYSNLLANINEQDIEKVTVLKNGTSIYGAKGANGVILIDTKRNSKERGMVTKIDVNLNGRYEAIPNLPDMMDASGYRSYVSEMLGSAGVNTSGLKFMIADPKYYYYNRYHNNTDWTKQVYRDGYTQNYGVNVSGGDEIANYSLSVGYSTGTSTLKTNGFNRFNIRLNSDIILTDDIDVRFDASYADLNRNLRDDGISSNVDDGTITSPGFLSLVKSPFLNPYSHDNQGRISTFLSPADEYLDQVISSKVSLANPKSILHFGEGINKNDYGNRTINLAITPTYRINRNMRLSEMFSYSLVNTNENYYLPLTGVPNFYVNNIGYVKNIAKGFASRQNIFYSDTRLDWSKRYGSQLYHVMGGFRYNNFLYSMNSLMGYNSGNDKTPNISSSLSNKSLQATDDKYTNLTYYAQADYNLKEKYYLNAGLSMEASSKFGADTKEGIKFGGVSWGVFPSLQAAWVMSSEDWLNLGDAVDYLKVYAGVDQNGNDDVDYMAGKSYFAAGQILQAISGISLKNIGNNTLQWETTTRYTAGINARLLNNRISLDAHGFTANTKNLATLKELGYLSGIEKNWSNDGSLKNSGYDVSLNAKVLDLEKVKWELGASVAHYKNELTSLPDNNKSFVTEIYGANVISKVGYPVGSFYGYRTKGVFATTDDATAAGLYQTNKAGLKQYFKAGDVRFVDRDGKDGITEDDQDIIGDPNPDFYGNVFTSLTVGHLNLSATVNYSLGNDVFNYERSILESGSRFLNQTEAMLNRWQSEGQVTDVPKVTYKDPMGNGRFSDRWIEDGSYLRLKNVTLSYAIPFRSEYIQKITVWGSAGNLLTLTKYLGSDPEFSLTSSVLGQGIDRGLLAQGRNFSVGLKINL